MEQLIDPKATGNPLWDRIREAIGIQDIARLQDCNDAIRLQLDALKSSANTMAELAKGTPLEQRANSNAKQANDAYVTFLQKFPYVSNR